MKLATVMPCYNHARYLSTSLCAILSQERQSDQIIFLDDGSTDDSLEVATSLLGNWPGAAIIRGQKNQGVVARCNQALTLTDADYIHFASANDQVLPGLYGKSLELLASHPTAALCCSIDSWAEPDGFHWRVGQRMADKRCYLSPVELVELGRQSRLQISSPSCVVRREALLELGPFRSAHAWHCDWFHYHGAAFRHGICFIPEALSRFGLAPGSFSSGMFDPIRQRPVLSSIVRDLEDCPHFASAMRQTGELAQFGSAHALRQVGGSQYITRIFRWHRTKIVCLRAGRRWLPKWLGQLYLNLCKQ